MVETSSAQSRLSTIRPGCTSGNVVCVRALASKDAIGDDVSFRRPMITPSTVATTHQPAATGTSRLSPFPLAPATVTAASTVAAAALMRTVVRRNSAKRMRPMFH